ncbi:MAG: Peroxide stress protein YaaA [Verrucomicrobiota bacterium]|jgi:hypothetical protein|nr:Peroxide stress protein YaaA [Verrucomicrobiota bacterium]
METGTAGQEDFTQSAFLDRSETLGAGLREFSTASRMEWMQISKPLAELNRKRFRGWKSPPFFHPQTPNRRYSPSPAMSMKDLTPARWEKGFDPSSHGCPAHTGLGRELNAGKQPIINQGRPDLRHDRILRGTEKRFDLQVLLDPLEEACDLPALFAGCACAVYSTFHVPRPTFHVPHSYTLSPSEVPRSLSNDRRERVIRVFHSSVFFVP